MRPFAGDDDDLTTMYVFIREVKAVYEKIDRKLKWSTRLRHKIRRWLLS